MAGDALNVQDNSKKEDGIQIYISKNTSDDIFHSDKEIWLAFKGGSRMAFKLIYERHIDSLYIYGNRITPNSDLVKDCIQDLFVDLWGKKSKLSVVKNIQAYLFISLRRRLVYIIKRGKNRIGIENCTNFNIALSDSMDSQLISDERKALLLKSLNDLSAQKKEAIFLRFYNDLSCAEVAEIMKIKTQSVYNLISTGLNVIKDSFKTVLPILVVIFPIY